MADDDDVKEYRWETGYEKTWEAIQEDDQGNLEASVAEIIQRAKRKAQMERKGHTRLGMMRHMYIILDASEAMHDQDLKPTRQLCTLKLMEGFVEEYLYENPLSQLGFILSRNKRAEKITELSGNYKKQLEVLKSNFGQPNSCSGEPSLQNALELALSSLKHMPSHAIREILVIMGSLTTCDPGDINITIQKLKTASIRASLIGLSADVRLCKSLCMTTGGDYGVVLDDVHFKHLLSTHALPPQTAAEHSSSALVKMGFPHHAPTDNKTTYLAMCMCHLDSEEGSKLDGGGYLCPQCRSKYCELPAECKVCGLTLVSAPHLARSYHHLFPVQPFSQIPVDQNRTSICFGCRVQFKAIDKQVGTLFSSNLDTRSVIGCNNCGQIIHVGCSWKLLFFQKTWRLIVDLGDVHTSYVQQSSSGSLTLCPLCYSLSLKLIMGKLFVGSPGLD